MPVIHSVVSKMMMMMTIYRVWISPHCNSMLSVLEHPQLSGWLFLSLMVCAGYVCVAIIHWTLTWTTGSLSCAQILMHAIAYRGVWTPKESLHWKLILGRKSLARLGSWTCISCVMVRCSNQLSCIPSPVPNCPLSIFKKVIFLQLK